MDDAVEQVVEEIVAACESMAGLPYDGEPVDQLQHALREHHGETAARWLEPRLGARIAWLAQQHVPAKRYLVATDQAYAQRLTPVSLRTLAAQGGPMSAAEIAAFEASSDWRLAIALRRFDDLGKVPDAAVPGLDAYSDDLRAAARERVGGTVR